MPGIVGFTQDIRRLFDCASSLREPSLINWQFVPACIYRFSQSLHPKIGELLGNCFETFADIVEFAGHSFPRAVIAWLCHDVSCSR